LYFPSAKLSIYFYISKNFKKKFSPAELTY